MIKISQPHLLSDSFVDLQHIFRSGHLVHGKYAEQAQEALATRLNSPHAILVSSGTAALHLALLTLDLGPQDAILVPNMTFPATVNVVHQVGARPVLVDVDPNSYVLNVETLTQAFHHDKGPQKIRALIVVHEFGFPADMPSIMDFAKANELLVIEDAACAITAHSHQQAVGTWGDIGCFSFHPRKIITCGEGGLVTCHRKEWAERLMRLKNHGIQRDADGVHFIESGLNYRLTDIQASLLLPQIEKVDTWVMTRRVLARYYKQKLQPLVTQGILSTPTMIEGHVWQSYVVKLADEYQADQIIQQMRSRGIETNCGAQILSHLPSVMQKYEHLTTHLSSHKSLYNKTLALPMCELYNEDTIEQVTQVLTEVLTSIKRIN